MIEPHEPRPDDVAVEKRKPPVPTVRLEALLQGGRELYIVHGEEIYRLLLTRNNKLILQK